MPSRTAQKKVHSHKTEKHGLSSQILVIDLLDMIVKGAMSKVGELTLENFLNAKDARDKN